MSVMNIRKRSGKDFPLSTLIVSENVPLRTLWLSSLNQFAIHLSTFLQTRTLPSFSPSLMWMTLNRGISHPPPCLHTAFSMK